MKCHAIGASLYTARAAIGRPSRVSILHQHGITNLIEIAGGLAAWDAAGLPVVAGNCTTRLRCRFRVRMSRLKELSLFLRLFTGIRCMLTFATWRLHHGLSKGTYR